MKKIYAILVAALMSVSLFAAPSQADLQSYMEDGFYVACFQAPATTTCNDIYWMGQYVDWNIATPLEDLVKCEELTGANAGWYVAKVPAANGTNGKPIQLNECGKLSWDVQPGPFDGKTVELIAGSVTINDKGAEYDLEGWSTTEPTIITVGSWKNGYDPCTRQCEQQSYTIRVYPPYCEYLDDVQPYIRGTFNEWGDPLAMEFKGSYFEYVSAPVSNNFEFKFNNSPDKENWDHQFEAYDAENDSWHFVPADGNLSLTNGTEYYTREGNVLTFDFSDDELFRYKGCEEPLPAVYKNATVTLTAPAGAPSAGVELVGGFGEGTWDNGILMTLAEGKYTASVENININDENKCGFKFRQAGSWANQIQIFDGENWKDLDNFSFLDFIDGDVITVILDLSNDALYKWTTPEGEGIENITLTEKAQKVAVDGVLYIIRDNKMFNAQGIQVR